MRFMHGLILAVITPPPLQLLGQSHFYRLPTPGETEASNQRI